MLWKIRVFTKKRCFFGIKYKTWDQRKCSLFTVENSPNINRVISLIETFVGVIGPGKSVHYTEVFIHQGCSLLEVSLFFLVESSIADVR